MSEKSVEAVLKEHTDRLMELPGVVGVAEGQRQGKPCIAVFVVKKTPGLLKQVPDALDGYSVEVRETGEILALDSNC